MKNTWNKGFDPVGITAIIDTQQKAVYYKP